MIVFILYLIQGKQLQFNQQISRIGFGYGLNLEQSNDFLKRISNKVDLWVWNGDPLANSYSYPFRNDTDWILRLDNLSY